MGVSSPNTRLIPGSSQGMVTDKTGGVDPHMSPMTLLRFSASSMSKESSYSDPTCSGSWGRSTSGLGCRDPSSKSCSPSNSGKGLRMSSEATSEKVSRRELMLLKSCEGPCSGQSASSPIWLGHLRVPNDSAVKSCSRSLLAYLAQEKNELKQRSTKETSEALAKERRFTSYSWGRFTRTKLSLCALARSTRC